MVMFHLTPVVPQPSSSRRAPTCVYGASPDAATRFAQPGKRPSSTHCVGDIGSPAFDLSRLQSKAVKRTQPFASIKRVIKGSKKPARRSLLAALQRMAPPTITTTTVATADDAVPITAAHPTVQQSNSDTLPDSITPLATALPADAETNQRIQLLQAQLQAAQADAAKEKAVRQRADDQVRTLTIAMDDYKAQLEVASEEVAKLTSENDRLQMEATALHSKSFTHSLAKPTTFSGLRAKNSLQARDWLQSIVDYMHSTNNATTELQKVQFAESYLIGEARRAWHAARITLAKPTESDMSSYAGITFAMFQQSIIDRWDPACSEIKAMNDLEELRQNGTLQSFVSNFDRICSYIPSMTDREKVHRFLKQIDPDLMSLLATDPTTKTRWTAYHDLRTYALNYVASAPALSARFNRKRPTGVLQNVSNTSAEGLQQLKRVKTDGKGGWQTVANKHKPAASMGHNGPQQQQQQTPMFQDFTNANGRPFRRHRSLVAWCHGHGICLCCFAHYNTEAEKAQHREHCTAEPKHNKALPDGYVIRKPQH